MTPDGGFFINHELHEWTRILGSLPLADNIITTKSTKIHERVLNQRFHLFKIDLALAKPPCPLSTVHWARSALLCNTKL